MEPCSYSRPAPSVPRPDDRERVDPVRMLRLDRMPPVTEPLVVTLAELGALLRPDAAGRDSGGDPQVEQ